ncbi:MAG TPA: SH3 domain-containing protein, partial [Thermodesulfobacteriota bacterium]|nr:SH3 domain-containing protein [Thermodesulfobacteriota bacterium]
SKNSRWVQMKGDIDKDLAQDNLKRISANFELELLRLIKTLNLISQSKELYKGQITFIQALTDRYKLKLSDFTIRLLDLERKSRDQAPEGNGDNIFAAPKEQALAPSAVADVVFEIRNYLNSISDEIEKNKEEYLQKLDSVYSVYNLQLGASQTDLDIKLRELQKEIARAAESSNGAGQKEIERTEDVKSIEYVKPTVREPEPEKPRPRNIDYIGPDEPPAKPASKPSAQTAAPAKPKPGIKSTPKTDEAEADKDAKIKNSYVIGAGLLILGIVVGVLFYDMLMRMWGVEKVPSVNETTYSSPAGKKEPAPAAKPPAAVKKAEAPKAPEPEPAKKSEPVQIAEQPKTPVSQPAAVKEPDKPEPQPAEPAAVSYTVIGVGANVRSGPGMGNDIVTVVNEGEVFSGTGEAQGRWVKIRTSDGKEGWISSKVIRKTP